MPYISSIAVGAESEASRALPLPLHNRTCGSHMVTHSIFFVAIHRALAATLIFVPLPTPNLISYAKKREEVENEDEKKRRIFFY